MTPAIPVLALTPALRAVETVLREVRTFPVLAFTTRERARRALELRGEVPEAVVVLADGKFGGKAVGGADGLDGGGEGGN